MKIERVEVLLADGGFRNLAFLKVTAGGGLVGWSEFGCLWPAPALRHVIEELGQSVVGMDPRACGKLVAQLRGMTHANVGGLVTQAIGAIENACLDLKGKAFGVPVYELFGGRIRDRLPLYWSHCGTFRVMDPDNFARASSKRGIGSIDDVRAAGEEVVAAGYKSLKTNLIVFEEGGPRMHFPGGGRGPGAPDLNLDDAILESIVTLMEAFRQGTKGRARLMLDLNFNYKPEGVRRIARALEPFDLAWLELDSYDPGALAAIRQGTSTPIASLENIFQPRHFLSFLEHRAVDVAIVDAQWNGFSEAMKLAALADMYGVNVASHNFHSHLSTFMGAHLSAAVPNFRIMEHDVDEVPWTRELFTHPLEVENGELLVPDRPGWGCDVNEEGLRRHPPRLA
jgi:galactonate dehydratase